MTVPTYQVPNPVPGRPLTVTISSVLLYVVAVVQLLTAGMTVATIGPVTDAYRSVFDEAELGTDVTSIFNFVLVLAAAFYAVIAIVLVVLAIFNSRGKNPSRIITWVFAGLGLCCTSIGLGGSVAGTLAGGTAMGGTSPDGLDQAQLEAELAASLPGWYEGAGLASSVITVLALLGVVILLALPQSNAFFRKPAGWNPAMPYPQYPGQPGYPGQAGHPGYPGQPQPGFYAGQQPPGYPPAGQQPGYPPAGYPPPGYPGAPSHLGSPEQYGVPGQPAPGLPPYPGQADSSAPAGPPSGSLPSGPPPAAPPSSAPPASSSFQPTSDPWATPPAAEANPWAPPSPPPSGDDQGGDSPPRPSSGQS